MPHEDGADDWGIIEELHEDGTTEVFFESHSNPELCYTFDALCELSEVQPIEATSAYH
jgi:hypothetical protein